MLVHPSMIHINWHTTIKSTNFPSSQTSLPLPTRTPQTSLQELYLNSEPKYHIISSAPLAFNMADGPSTSSEANPKPLPTPPDFMNAPEPEDALRMAVEIYNDIVKPDYQLNWENIKGIFDTTEKNPQDFSEEENRKRSRQRKKDKGYVERYVKLVKGLKDHTMLELADFLLCELDNRGIINCHYRGKPWTGLQEDFPEDARRAFPAYD
jgi:hypothetical protein